MQVAPFSGFRDRRIDLLRGSALLMIFFNHVPGNALSRLTIRNYAFSDAAEIFVFLAGYSAWLSYGSTFERSGAWAGIRRVLTRCWHLYLAQATLLTLSVAIASVWSHAAGLEPGLLLQIGAVGLIKALVLYAQPSFYNILPLYICLLLAFPLVWLGLRQWPGLTLLASASLWSLVNAHHEVNLPEWVDQDGWNFNPFAWQLIFVLGATTAAMNGSWQHSIQRRRWVAALCWIFLAGGWLTLRYWWIAERPMLGQLTGP